MLTLPNMVERDEQPGMQTPEKTSVPIRVLSAISPSEPHDLARIPHSGNLGIGTNAVKEGMTLKELLSNPSVSQWLKDALMTAYDRDPIDAIRDAQSLLKLLGDRYTQIVTRSPEPFGQ
jgi:hypothetical protein